MNETNKKHQRVETNESYHMSKGSIKQYIAESGATNYSLQESFTILIKKKERKMFLKQ